jgi:hypothetical protein
MNPLADRDLACIDKIFTEPLTNNLIADVSQEI